MTVKLNKTYAGYYTYDKDKSPINTDFLRTEINLDILHGCAQSCPGCFIPRKNLTKPEYLETLYNLLVNGSYYPDEITVGPTDIFDAENFHEIMNHPYMKKLYGISAVGFTSTLLQPYAEIRDKLDKIWSLYEGIHRVPDIDFKIVLDIDKYLDGELDDWNRKLKMFELGSVQFRVNYHKDVFKRISYNDLCQRIFDDYNAPVIITPSFLTDRNARGKVEQHLANFRREMVEQNIDKKWLNLYTFFDAKFNGYGCQNYSFYNNKLYLNPFLYDVIIQRTPNFETTMDANTLYDNIEYAQQVDDCNGCEYMMSCAERNIHLYMESRGLDNCVALKEYMYTSD